MKAAGNAKQQQGVDKLQNVSDEENDGFNFPAGWYYILCILNLTLCYKLSELCIVIRNNYQ